MHEVLHEQLMRMARYVRDPLHTAPPPGIEARRLAVYRQLFIGNIESLLAGGFPVVRASLGTQQWQALIESFYADYRCQTPLFTEVSSEFLAFLEEVPDLPPWVLELAHYEWVEAALLLSDKCEPAHEVGGDLLDGVPVLSPQAWPLAYQWPVCDIGPDYLPNKAPDQPTLLLARRGNDLQVHFSRLAPLAHALLASLQACDCTGREHLQSLAETIGVDVAAILAQGLVLLESLREQGIVLGVRNMEATSNSR